MKNFILLIAIALCLLPFGVFSATITVTNNNDSGSGSLRQAISDASNGDEITFNLASGSETITLASELSISNSLTINGSNVAGSGIPVTVQVTTPGSSTYRVFNLNAVNKTINISDMIIKGGDVSGSGNNGGSINLTNGNLSLTNVSMLGSKAKYGGGICAVEGTSAMTVNLTNCIISDCACTFNGAGFIAVDATTSIVNSTFENNTSIEVSS